MSMLIQVQAKLAKHKLFVLNFKLADDGRIDADVFLRHKTPKMGSHTCFLGMIVNISFVTRLLEKPSLGVLENDILTVS